VRTAEELLRSWSAQSDECNSPSDSQAAGNVLLAADPSSGLQAASHRQGCRGTRPGAPRQRRHMGGVTPWHGRPPRGGSRPGARARPGRSRRCSHACARCAATCSAGTSAAAAAAAPPAAARRASVQLGGPAGGGGLPRDLGQPRARPGEAVVLHARQPPLRAQRRRAVGQLVGRRRQHVARHAPCPSVRPPT